MGYTKTSYYDGIIRRQIRSGRASNKTEVVHQALSLLDAVTRSRGDRKSTRLNSSHQIISYAVFCLKKKNNSVINSAARQTLCLDGGASHGNHPTSPPVLGLTKPAAGGVPSLA